MSDFIVNIDETNAARLLIEESNIRPVVVDFWADWCEPCKTLMPLLEKIANEYQGAFLLAKVNADEQGMIAQQFGVRSLPTVMIIQGGQSLRGATVTSFGDHRIAMAFAIAGLFAEGETIIENASCVNTSYPGFASSLEQAMSPSHQPTT